MQLWRAARSKGLTLVVVFLAVALAGCVAGTRTGRFGLLPGNEALVTLVVTEDLAVVERECLNIATSTQLLGCQMSYVVAVPGPSGTVQTVKIVRYTDSLPSEMAFEIDIHELCHAIAAVQGIDDPCHAHDGDVVRSYRPERQSLFSR